MVELLHSTPRIEAKANWTGGRSAGKKKRQLLESPAVLVPIEAFRPTQMAVGMRSVLYKRRKLEMRAQKRKQLEKILCGRPLPVVRGPGSALFLIDNHHFSLALWHAEVEHAYAAVIDDLSHLAPNSFWWQMEAEGRLHPFNESGRRVSPSRLPRSVNALRHDPYRDLAWQVRRAGGFAKTAIPFAEFFWANLFRSHIAADIAERPDGRALKHALKLARSPAAADLPGYIAGKR